MDYRIEKDTLGEVKVPKDKLWGAQTERKNFQTVYFTICEYSKKICVITSPHPFKLLKKILLIICLPT